MPLETGTFISDLVTTNPAHTDGLNNADAHLRLIKSAIKATFPSINGAVSATDEDLNASANQTRVLTGPDGSSGAPVYSFASEATLGFYRQSAGEIGIAGRLRGNGAVEPGALMDFATATAPAGWLACDGQAVSRTTFADLFAAIGTTWGIGDGTLTFNVPPLQTRFRRHRDGSTISGAVGNLQAPANLTHTHAVTGNTGIESVGHTHTFSGNTGTMSANASHTHGVTGGTFGGTAGSSTGGGGFSCPGTAVAITISATNTDHTHSFSGTTSADSVDHTHAISLTSAAQGDANESRPFSATVLTCIKT